MNADAVSAGKPTPSAGNFGNYRVRPHRVKRRYFAWLSGLARVSFLRLKRIYPGMTAHQRTFRCFLVSKDPQQNAQQHITDQPLSNLPEGDVLIRVAWSSLNYKDALAATGHAGVARTFPHVPGIDAAGVIDQSSVASLKPGDEVIVTGYELGAGRWGGWSEYIRVPADWVVPCPAGLTLREAMVLGTAGFTAAQCVRALRLHTVTSEGPIVVTGATGGVGSLAVQLLGQLGYEVVAVTGKLSAHQWLRELGAARVVSREQLTDDGDSARPLCSARWAGAVDTVGGPVLSLLLRSTRVNGCVAACGMVGGSDLPMTVYPFILRGVTLAGITSANCPRAARLDIWNQLAGPWKLNTLDSLATEANLGNLPSFVQQILESRIRGRVIVNLTDPTEK